MGLPWGQILNSVIGVTDRALSMRRERQSSADDDRPLTSSPRAFGNLEARLAGVMVAALKEAFDRDTKRLDLERDHAAAERQRAERALRLELRRQALDREIARLRMTAAVAAAAWIGTLVLAARLIGGSIAARAVLGGGWACLLAAIAASFLGQSSVTRATAALDERDAALESSSAGNIAAIAVVLGLALAGIAVLIA
jgi:hypothetical protein